MKHARSANRGDSIPRISTGKLTRSGDRLTMPVSLDVHHGFIDGRQAGEFFRTAGKPRMKSGSGIRFLFLKDGTKQMKKILNKFINLPFDSHTRKNEENPARPAPAAGCSADPRKHSAPSGHQFSRKLHASGRHRPLPEPVRHGGFLRLTEGGARFTEGSYDYQQTSTPVSLATLTTGAMPSTHGVISTRWRDYIVNKTVGLIDDPSVRDPNTTTATAPTRPAT